MECTCNDCNRRRDATKIAEALDIAVDVVECSGSVMMNAVLVFIETVRSSNATRQEHIDTAPHDECSCVVCALHRRIRDMHKVTERVIDTMSDISVGVEEVRALLGTKESRYG